MKQFLLFLFLLLLFLLGFLLWKHCGTDIQCMKNFFMPAPTPTATATPTATSIPAKPGVPTRVPTRTPTKTDTPTKTATPTNTFTPTDTFTPTNTFTPTHTFTPTYTFTFTPICTANPVVQGVREAEPNENETQATILGALRDGSELVVVGKLSRVGRQNLTGVDRDVYKVDLESAGCVAILDCYTYIPGPPQPSRHDQNFYLNVYDQLFAPLYSAKNGGPIAVADMRQNPSRILYFEVVGYDGKPGAYRLTIRK